MRFPEKLWRFSPVVAVALSWIVASVSCSSRDAAYNNTEGIVWNTTFHVTYRGPESLGDSVLVVLDSVGRSLNVFDSTSVVSRVNAAPDSMKVDAAFREVYVASLVVNKKSGGMFEPTLSPLITAWGFGKGHTATADTARVDSLLRFVGISRTVLRDGYLVKSEPEIQFNFSAIAKGYGCDCVGRMLRRNGVQDYLVEIGGEVVASGVSPRGDKWRLSVDRPVLSESDVLHDSQAVIEVSGCGVATSGNYRNFHSEKGRRWGHTINPVSGRPEATDVISATVVAPTAMEADAYATSAMAMGSRRFRRLADELKLPVMLVLADSSVWMSDRFRNMVVE